MIKFGNEQRARLDPQGKLDLASASDADRVGSVLAEHGLQLKPMLRLVDAKLDALEDLSAHPFDLRALYAASPSTHRERELAAASELLELDGVEYVYLEPLDVPPPGDLAPTTLAYVDRQTYRGPEGIDAIYAATVGATGSGIRLLDVEYGWTYAHEDLVDRSLNPEPGHTLTPEVISRQWDQHGTAVIGETSAVANGYGVTGLVPDADVFTFPEMSVEGGYRRVEAVAAAVAAARPGDVVLLEMQTPGALGNYGPAEFDPAVWQIVKTATDAGIIVVAAAGNGTENLDAPAYAAYRARGDSGAIIVGAASHTGSRLGFSTYGERVNVHGWGEGVVTLGYGDLFTAGNDLNQAYTAQFAGTSSASPIVAAACVAIQSYAKEQLRRVLTPAELRDLLVQTGRPQADPGAGAIGPLPNLRAALERLSTGTPPPPPPPPPGTLIINEILADPPAGYDASGDGVASTIGDEFIELVNVGGTAIDLSGATISDAVGVRVTLPAGTTLAPNGVLVVFGGAPLGAGVSGVRYVSAGSLALNNSGDTVTVKQGAAVLATATYGGEGGGDQSLVRSPERSAGAPFVKHRSVATTPASPGVRANGTPL
ncbi:MAG: S8 family serine peptidase [Myxococcota bacterium]|nr:S8 family serine peptidase [Myxococcota bacterium]